MVLTEQQREQRRAALRRANEVRTSRAAIKRALVEGERTLADLLFNPPPEILKAPIGEVLEWMPGVGTWRCGRILAGGPGSPGVGRMLHVEHLSTASKQRILARFEAHVPVNQFYMATG